jgi:hypothetical protein
MRESLTWPPPGAAGGARHSWGGWHLRRVGQGPSALDRAARPLTALLPLTPARPGRPARARTAPAAHLLLGLPLAAILLVFVGRLALRRRTEAPWLLPALNLALIAAALPPASRPPGPEQG